MAPPRMQKFKKKFKKCKKQIKANHDLWVGAGQGGGAARERWHGRALGGGALPADDHRLHCVRRGLPLVQRLAFHAEVGLQRLELLLQRLEHLWVLCA